MSVQNQALALEANLQAEIGAKKAQIELLDAQERAISASDVEALATSARELQVHIQREVERATKRAVIIADLTRSLDLPNPSTVGRIAEALGSRGRALAARRTELRAQCAACLKKSRHVGALVRGHARVVEEALGRYLSPDPSGAPLGSGSLVDAEA